MLFDKYLVDATRRDVSVWNLAVAVTYLLIN